MGRVEARGECVARRRTMKRRLIISRAARQDYLDSVKWFDQSTGNTVLGDRFTIRLNEAFVRIVDHPERFGPSPYGGRRLLLDKFLHAVHFVEVGSIIHITAIWHQRRNPVVLKKRHKSP